MSIQHRNIPDTESHEPKNVSSATNGQVYVANGSGSGTWKKVNQVDSFDFSNKAKNVFGWNDIADSLYTSSSPRALTSGARVKLTNNGLKAQTDTSRLGAIWDTTNNKFLINDLNAFYIVRVQMRATAAAAAGTPYIMLFETQSSNGPTVVSGNTQFIKGGGAVNIVSFTTGIYLGSFINNADLEIYVTPDTNMNIYDIGFVIQRAYKET